MQAAPGARWAGHPETNYSGIQHCRQLASNTASLHPPLRLRAAAAAALLLLQEMLASGELVHLLLILLQEVCPGILPG